MTLAISITAATLLVGLIGRNLWHARIAPHSFGLPNWITLARNIPVGWILALLSFGDNPHENLIIFGLAAFVLISDGLDGYFARKLNQCTAFGARFDMESDAFFILVLCIGVIVNCDAPWWTLFIGLMRYMYLGAQPFVSALRLPIKERYSRKVFCVIQIVSLMLPFTGLFSTETTNAILLLSLACLIFSFGRDIRDQYNDNNARLTHEIL